MLKNKRKDYQTKYYVYLKFTSEYLEAEVKQTLDTFRDDLRERVCAGKAFEMLKKAFMLRNLVAIVDV